MSDFKFHTIFTEKYRPQTISECILPSKTLAEFSGFLAQGRIPNLLLCGPAGTGKTTAALALCRQLDYDCMIINSSNEGRLIDTLRNKITNFASSVSLEGKHKAVILDEADHLPMDIQSALRAFIEEYASNTSFILTCNFPNRIIQPLHSRCAVIDFTVSKSERPQMMLDLFKRVSMILDSESIEFDKKALLEMIRKFFPDMRRLLNELQRCGVNGSINNITTEHAFGSDIAELISHLKNRDFKETRKWVASTPNADISYVARELYNSMYDICEHEDMPTLILILADYQYKAAFVADKEINMMAMFCEILSAVRFK